MRLLTVRRAIVCGLALLVAVVLAPGGRASFAQVAGRGPIQTPGGGRGPGAAPAADDPANAYADLSPKPPVVFATYVCSLVFTLKTHPRLFAGGGEGEVKGAGATEAEPGVAPPPGARDSGGGHHSRGLAVRFVVGTVEAARAWFGFTDVFVGVVIVAVIGNAAEHSTAVLVAVRNKMDPSLAIAIGSSQQVALFVAPILVFALVPPRALRSNSRSGVVTVITPSTCQPHLRTREQLARSAQLIALYLVLAMLFYYLPRSLRVYTRRVPCAPTSSASLRPPVLCAVVHYARALTPVGGRGAIQSPGGGRGPGAAPAADNPANAYADLSPKPPVVAATARGGGQALLAATGLPHAARAGRSGHRGSRRDPIRRRRTDVRRRAARLLRDARGIDRFRPSAGFRGTRTVTPTACTRRTRCSWTSSCSRVSRCRSAPTPS